MLEMMLESWTVGFGARRTVQECLNRRTRS
jgi:hypothetical protein